MTRPFFAMGSYKTRTAMSSASVMAASGASYVAMQPQFSATSSATSGGASRVNAELSVIPSLTPSLRGFSIARAAMSSPFSAAVGFGGSSTVVSDTTWTNPNPTTLNFYNTGVAQQVDLAALYLQNFNPSTQTVRFVSGDTNDFDVSAAGVLTFDGNATVGTYPMTFEVVDNAASGAAADFAARSAGAVFAQNWSSFADAAAARNHQSCSAANKVPADGSVFLNAFELITTPSHVLSGKALRLYHGKNPSQYNGDLNLDLVIDNQWWIIPANGNKNDPANAWFSKLYVQWIVWTDEYIDYHWKIEDGTPGGGPGGPKFAIFDTYATSGAIGEFVVHNGPNRGFPRAYRRSSINGSDVGIERSVSTPANGTNYSWQNAVDRGTPATIVTQNDWERRYGPCYSGMTGGSSQADWLHNQGVPDPDAAIGGVTFNRGGFTVIEQMVDVPNQRLQVWAAHHGNLPLLILDTALDNTSGNTANIGSRVFANGFAGAGTIGGTGYSGLTLTNLMFKATDTVNPGRPAASYTDYAEIIFSQNPINFPGGYALPGL